MARPKETDQVIWALHYFLEGPRKAGIIATKLQLKFGDKTVTKRTVERWMEDFRVMDTTLDQPFEWHQLEKYGLPWESSDYLMGLLFAYQTLLHYPPPPPPTARQVMWWWRVHLAAPKVEQEIDVMVLAQRFVVREIGKDILGQKLEFKDLEAHLIYKPWEGPFNRELYFKAIQKGRIPSLIADPDHANTVELLSNAPGEIQPINRFLNSLALGVSLEHPELLFSQQVDDYLEGNKNTDTTEPAEGSQGVPMV